RRTAGRCRYPPRKDGSKPPHSVIGFHPYASRVEWVFNPGASHNFASEVRLGRSGLAMGEVCPRCCGVTCRAHPVCTVAEFEAATYLRPIGGFMAMSLDVGLLILLRPFHWRELLDQIAFLARVSLFPAILLIIPLAGFVVFVLLQLFAEIGATDLSGAVSGLAVVREVGPIASVLVVAGAGASAICAELGARTIREEIDAMAVLGIDPVHRLVVPRVLASGVVAVLVNTITSLVGLVVCYLFSIKLFNSSVGQFVAT